MPTTTSAPSSATPVAATVQPKLRTSCVPACLPAFHSKPESKSRSRRSQRAARRPARWRSARTHRDGSTGPRGRARSSRRTRWRRFAGRYQPKNSSSSTKIEGTASAASPTSTRLFPRYCGIGVARPRRKPSARSSISDLLDHLDVGRLDGKIAVVMRPRA